ncbi:hypothetical protein [Terrabacter terrigena]|uniref:Uncharacterized protein n=1 Tax=Terrabacter terrigena TaxID=574718 RepID=A0ABW3MUL9_9MICO
MSDRTPADPTVPEPTPEPVVQPVPPTPTDAPRADTPAAEPSKRTALFKRFGGAFLAIIALFAFRAFTADDGTHGIKTGECVAAVGTDDFKKVDCADSTSLGTVTFIQADTATDQTSALSLCEKHGAQGAFTSVVGDGGRGTIVCVADPK